MIIKRIFKFAIVLAALVVFAPVYIPYAAWSVSGEDK